MNLLDPSRPRQANGRPLLECGTIAPELSVMPLGNGHVEVSAWLPVVGARFEAKRFTAVLRTPELIRVMGNYELDPEAELERLFFAVGNGLTLDVRSRRAQGGASAMQVSVHNIEI